MAEDTPIKLAEKLDIQPDTVIAFHREPEDYFQWVGDLPQGVTLLRSFHDDADNALDWLHAFYTTRAIFQEDLPDLLDAVDHDGLLWISWPQPDADIDNDMTLDDIQEIAAEHNLTTSDPLTINADWQVVKLMVTGAEAADA